MPSTFSRGFHAAIYDALCGYFERRGFLEWRKALVGDLRGEIVELGAGTGKNFRHYPPDAKVIASDIDPFMLARAVPRAERAQAEVSLLLADAMALPFDDATADVAVVGLMLCSVPEPDATLAEVRRILRPGGRLRFVEHVRDKDGTWRARIQDVVNPAWVAVSGGCNANRRTAETIVNAGFEVGRLHEFKIGHLHTAPHVMGEATAP